MEIELLLAAIREQRLIHLVYEGTPRHLEAYALGKDGSGQDILVARQVHPWVPAEKSWRVFRVKNIYGLLVLDKKFSVSEGAAKPPTELVADLCLAG